jgi:xanthine dehydrogenase YagS FAD-binding subunit
VSTVQKRVIGARVVLSGVAPIPWRSKPAEQALEGGPVAAGAAARVAAAAVTGAEPMEHNGYKVPLLQGVVHDAVSSLAS